jgi:DNA mismatch repair ATPase MutS
MPTCLPSAPTPGACPKSYGTNVARLAGLPGAVVSRAAAISARTHSDSRAAAHLTSVPHTLRGAVTHAAKYLQEVLGPQEGGAEHQPAALAVRGLLGVQRSVSKLLQSAAV